MPNVQYVNQLNVKSDIDYGQEFERYLLSLITEKSVTNNLSNTQLINIKSSVNNLRNFSEEAAQYHLSCGGKRIRANIATKAGTALGLTKQNSMAIAAIAELLHNGSLVHDDLQDGDEVRRGNEAVWFKYGKDIAICTGDLLISAAYSALADITNTKIIPHMISVIHTQTAAAIKGQSYDVHNKIQAITNLHDYEQVVIAKSGALLSLPIQLALIASKNAYCLDKAQRIANAFALIYQITDDLNDIHNDQVSDQKPSVLNIIFVLQNAGFTHNALSHAKQIALQKASECIRLSQELPHQSGAYLGELASALKSKLLN